MNSHLTNPAHSFVNHSGTPLNRRRSVPARHSHRQADSPPDDSAWERDPCVPSGRQITEIFEIRGLLEITSHVITDREQLLTELEDVRANGYATDDEERILSVRYVATPVLDDTGWFSPL